MIDARADKGAAKRRAAQHSRSASYRPAR
jgi:hypothetical protein